MNIRLKKKIQPVFQIKSIRKFQHDQAADDEKEEKFLEYQKMYKRKKVSIELILTEEGIKTCTYSNCGIEVFDFYLSIFDCKA